eukprot:3535699-Pyramimonas_sp.AAC.1
MNTLFTYLVTGDYCQPGGVVRVRSSEDPRGPQRRLQTAHRGVQYVKGVHGSPNDRQLPTTAMFEIPRTRLRVEYLAGSGGTQD